MERRRSRPRPPLQLGVMAVVAAWTAGFVDVVGYLLLAHIFTANMSGNSIRIGAGAAMANGGEVLRRAWPVAFFTAGLIGSAVVHETGCRRGFLSTSAITFGLEASLFAIVQELYLHGATLSGSSSVFYLPAAMLAFAMGMQNATLTRVGPLSVRTTHVSGAVSEFAEGFSKFAFWAFDRLRGTGAHRVRRVLRIAMRQEPLQEAVLLGSVWVTYVIGALAGTAAIDHLGGYLLMPPIAVAMVFLVIDVVRPIAASSEHARR